MSAFPTVTCPTCGEEYSEFKGHSCTDPSDIFEAAGIRDESNVSDVEDMLDRLVAEASVPDLSALYKKGRESGAIPVTHEYGGT